MHFFALLSSIFPTFWTYNKRNYFFPWKMWTHAIVSSNCALLSAIFSIFLTDNKCFFRKRGKWSKLLIIGQKSRKSTRNAGIYQKYLKNTLIIDLKSQKNGHFWRFFTKNCQKLKGWTAAHFNSFHGSGICL